MARSREADAEAKRRKRNDSIGWAIESDVTRAVEDLGGSLTGITFKWDTYQVMAIIKADFEGKDMVAFCASGDWPSVILKLVAEGKGNKLRWRPDKYRGPN